MKRIKRFLSHSFEISPKLSIALFLIVFMVVFVITMSGIALSVSISEPSVM